MRPKEAAKLIGCSAPQVIRMIRAGKLAAKRIPDDGTPQGFYYLVDPDDAKRIAKLPNKSGWPRGKPRGKKPDIPVKPRRSVFKKKPITKQTKDNQ